MNTEEKNKNNQSPIEKANDKSRLIIVVVAISALITMGVAVILVFNIL